MVDFFDDRVGVFLAVERFELLDGRHQMIARAHAAFLYFIAHELSENRFTLFGIMRYAANNCRPSCPVIVRSRIAPGATGAASLTLSELLGVADAAALGQHKSPCADLRVEMSAQRRIALFAQDAGALLDDVACELRHARGRRAGPRRKRKDMQLRQPAFVDEIERAREHIVALGREAGDDVGAEGDVGPQPAHPVAERDGVSARMPPLHALEDEIVAGLQRQMQMRHQPRLVGQGIEQIAIGLDRIDRRQPQTRELWDVLEDALDQRAQPHAAAARSW